ncbi:DUF3885 domain-containing protein [Paenibacillus yanchengensis]
MEHNQHLDDFLLRIFTGVHLKSPLFYNVPIGIRFELGGNIVAFEERAEQVKERAITLFDAINQSDDNIYFVLFMDSWNEHPIKAFEKDVFKVFVNYVKRIDLDKICMKEQEFRHKEADEIDDTVTIRYCAKVKVQDVDVNSLIGAIANRTLGLEPTVSGDIYLINETNRTIFHFYDDRGLDIVAENTKVLKKVYEQYNHWILDYDRERINEIFS